MRMSEEELCKLITQGLVYYEREEKDLNMLLFPEILENITHIDRTLSSFRGHLLLVGRAGVGRRNATTIVSYMLGHEFYSPAISRDYGPKQFSIDVKNVLLTAGVKGEHAVLFIEDFQITSDSILEITNSLISSGEVPGLYTHEELETILGPLREKMREEGGLFRTPYEFFIYRIKKYLHVVLSMDPGHSQFLYRCEANPALYSQCTVLWFGEWRPNSLKVIPLLMDGVKSLISGRSGEEDEEMRGESKAESKGESKRERGESKRSGGESKQGSVESTDGSALIDMIISIHGTCSASHGASPKDFQELLSSWLSLFHAKEKEVKTQLLNLRAGLSKLDTASAVVTDLRTNAAQQQRDLAAAQAAADRAMDEISKALSSATERRVEVTNISRTVEADREVTDAKKREIEDQLAEIQPVLDSAKQAVGQIKPDHLNEIRSLTAPPEAIADVLAAVLMLLGVQDLSWLSMKKFLGNRGVKDDILNFNAKGISDELRKNVSKMIKKKSESFEAANITRVSVAAAPMAAWVKANIRYSLVIEKIEPLEAELEQEIYKLEQSQKRLQKCEDELRELDDRVGALKQEFSEKTAETERLKRNLAIAGTTLDKAEGLIGQLGGEQARWKTQAAQLQSDLSKLPTKMLLAAGFETYLAKAPEDIRAKLISQWQDICLISAFSFKRVMSTESELLQWKSMGLPSDDLSQENGLVIAHLSNRVPLIIDPASVAVDWLKNYLSKDKTRPLEIVSHHDRRFSNQVELSVRFGKALVILEVDGVEPMLYPLCRRDLCHQGPRYTVSVGDKVVDFNECFRLFLVTRNPQPDIPPDAASLVTVVNFTVTRSGLEGQLLGLAIQHEQPELERAKGEMLKKEEDFKVQLAELERDLLQALATAEGNLLENTTLIESLTRTKEKAAEIEDALQRSAEASVQLDEQREVYRPFAHDGSKVFFLVKSLQTVCHMYQFSLSSFLQLYNQALSSPIESKHVDERLQKLCADIEIRVLYFVGRALVKGDRAMFAMHLVRGMHADHFQLREWEIFIGSLVVSVGDVGALRNYPSWGPSDRQSAFRLLSEQLPHLITSLELDNTQKWQRFSTALEAEKEIPPLRGVSPFQKVLLIQALRPDRLHSAILNFCCELLRIETVSPPPLSLNSLYEESSTQTPILLISSPGADPSKELQEFAGKTVGGGNYDELAMGGGQQEIAIQMVRNAAQHGTWLCLKNLHLVVAWLPTLEKELSSLQANKDFRLWLTSESHTSFPSILLQQSLKVAYESPPGIKKNLQRAFEAWGPEDFLSTSPVRGDEILVKVA
jgi:dynein heavy chain 2, cytosolic